MGGALAYDLGEAEFGCWYCVTGLGAGSDIGVIIPFAPLARREGELPVGGVEWATIGEVVISIVVLG